MYNSPYQAPYDLGHLGTMGTKPQMTPTGMYAGNPQLRNARSQTFPDGSMLLDPGEPVPPGYTVENTYPNGQVAVVPGGGASGGGGGGGGGSSSSSGSSSGAGSGLAGIGAYEVGKDILSGSSSASSAATQAPAAAPPAAAPAATPPAAAPVAAPPAAAPGAAGLGTGAAVTGSGAYPVATMADGATLMSDGSIFPGSMAPAAETGTTGAGSTIGGVAPALGLAAMAYLYGNNLYQNAGKDIMAGTANRGNWMDAALGSNLLTGWVNPMMNAVGLGSVGSYFTGGRTEIEERRQDAMRDYLQQQGYTKEQAEAFIPRVQEVEGKQLGEDIKTYGPEYTGFNPEGRWVNTKFGTTRDESALQPEDIWGYATFGAKFGPTWYTGSEEDRWKIAKLALEAGAVREHHGTIDVDWDKVQQYAQSKGEGYLPEYAPNRPPSQAAGAAAPTTEPGEPGTPEYSETREPDQIPKAKTSWDPKTSPQSRSDYKNLSKAEKDKLWAEHRKAMGATW